MKFRDMFSLKYFLFALLILAVMVPFVIIQSNNTVKIDVDETEVFIRSSRYQMLIGYDIIDSLDLQPLAEPGEKTSEDSFDDGVVRYGQWKNDVWGTYSVCADLDVDNCIVAHLNDGRIFVFNRKNNAETEAIYQQLLEKLPGVLAPGGKVAILTFHSGEDRLVKKTFKRHNNEGLYSEIAEEVIRPSMEECVANSRAKSTKMRWAVRAEQ